MKAIIGKKVGMSQIFDENGKVIPVTVIEAGPCVVVQKKTAEKDGYNAVQLGYEDIPERNLIAVRGAVPGPKGGLVLIKTTVKVHRVKNVESGISNNPQKASGRNPQKASARNK